MPEPHQVLNALDTAPAADALRRACGAERWVKNMLALRPYASAAELWSAAERCWAEMREQDLLEAFSQHPQIGEDLAELERRFGATAHLSAREQAGIDGASAATLLALRDANRRYRDRFGFIFIVCASGKSAREMLDLLQARLGNERETELAIAAREQAQITRLRLQGLAT